ncbi:MAG: putative Fe-S cluster assembly protein SufT [Candidatus Binatia bacterium]
MKSDKPITLSRDCDATQIPSGNKFRLPAGSQVWITQSLGGGYTVTTDRGYMVRIAGRDADALGMEIAVPLRPGTSTVAAGPADVEELVWDQLRTCFDPEIPINIVDLGLVYHCRVTPLAEGGSKVEVRFTLTAPGCGMGEALKEDIRTKILSVQGIKDVDIELVWDPPWDQSMISGAAKLQLGML